MSDSVEMLELCDAELQRLGFLLAEAKALKPEFVQKFALQQNAVIALRELYECDLFPNEGV